MSFSGLAGLAMSLNLELNVKTRSNDIGSMWAKPENTNPFLVIVLQWKLDTKLCFKLAHLLSAAETNKGSKTESYKINRYSDGSFQV